MYLKRNKEFVIAFEKSSFKAKNYGFIIVYALRIFLMYIATYGTNYFIFGGMSKGSFLHVFILSSFI